MNNEELKVRIGTNIARLRKTSGMTQADLAERLNYSDKAVSKWERAESMPDVLTLMLLAEQFGTDVNELVSDPDRQPEVPILPAAEEAPVPVSAEPEKKQKKQKKSGRKADKGIIQKLCSILVWTVALFLFIVMDSFHLKYSWMIFLVAVLANAITLLSLRSAWRLYGINSILISVIMWTALLIIYLSLWLW